MFINIVKVRFTFLLFNLLFLLNFRCWLISSSFNKQFDSGDGCYFLLTKKRKLWDIVADAQWQMVCWFYIFNMSYWTTETSAKCFALESWCKNDLGIINVIFLLCTRIKCGHGSKSSWVEIHTVQLRERFDQLPNVQGGSWAKFNLSQRRFLVHFLYVKILTSGVSELRKKSVLRLSDFTISFCWSFHYRVKFSSKTWSHSQLIQYYC